MTLARNVSNSIFVRVLVLSLFLIATLAAQEEEETVRGVMQPMPGEPAALIDAGVRKTPSLPFVDASEVKLKKQDLVLGVAVDGQAWALPIRFIGLYEVVNSRLGDLPVTATW